MKEPSPQSFPRPEGDQPRHIRLGLWPEPAYRYLSWGGPVAESRPNSGEQTELLSGITATLTGRQEQRRS